jgi:hypothetical protein
MIKLRRQMDRVYLCSMHGEMENALGRSIRRSEDNIKVNFKEIPC